MQHYEDELYFLEQENLDKIKSIEKKIACE